MPEYPKSLIAGPRLNLAYSDMAAYLPNDMFYILSMINGCVSIIGNIIGINSLLSIFFGKLGERKTNGAFS
jgi:hypothetical protein